MLTVYLLLLWLFSEIPQEKKKHFSHKTVGGSNGLRLKQNQSCLKEKADKADKKG